MNLVQFLLVPLVSLATSLGNFVPVAGGNGPRFLKSAPSLTRFELDPARSRFMVHARRGGLAWFKGHDHFVAVRDFSGHADLTLDVLNPATLELVVRADSLEETDPDFTDQQKEIINRELDEIVLESARYPEIVFRSTSVRGRLKDGQFEVKITGDLTLHGVTRRITIPARVSVSGNEMRATGEFGLDRSDYGVKATSAFHGLVRVRNGLQFTIDIVGRRV